MRKLSFLVIPILLFFFQGALSQSPQNQLPSDEILAAMEKLKPLVGKWEGKATIQQGPNKMEIQQTETVSLMMNGSALLIEGKGFDMDGNVVYEAMGLLVYSPFTDTYNMRAVKGNGMYLDANVEVGENQLQWDINIPNGGISRQTVTFSDEEWKEVGAYSQDKENWKGYLTMSLTKVE